MAAADYNAYGDDVGAGRLQAAGGLDLAHVGWIYPSFEPMVAPCAGEPPLHLKHKYEATSVACCGGRPVAVGEVLCNTGVLRRHLFVVWWVRVR